MITQAHPMVIPTDIDGTLLIWGKIPKGAKAVLFTDPYTQEQKTVRINEANVRVLTNHLERGTLILAWSQSGYKWVEATMKALGVSHYANIVAMNKPIAYLDDTPCKKWMGERINLPVDSDYGKSYT